MLPVQLPVPLSTGNNDAAGVWLLRYFQDALFSSQLLKEGAKDINVGGSARLGVSMNNFGIFDGNLAGSASPLWWVPLRSTRIGKSALRTPSVGKTYSTVRGKQRSFWAVYLGQARFFIARPGGMVPDLRVVVGRSQDLAYTRAVR
jgi:hypothetical protein